MKEDYLKIILVLLIAVIAIQGYYLYDVNRSKNIKNEFFDAMVSADGFFDENTNPFIEMERLRHKMQRNFRDIEDYFQAIPSFNKFTLQSYRVPRFDMKEQKGKYIITMEIPGSLSNAIETQVKNSRLSVSAKISEEKDDNSTNYYRHERHARSYRHEVMLPADVDADSLQKEYKDGLLILTLDKKKP